MKNEKKKIHKSLVFKLILLIMSAILITVAFYSGLSLIAFKNINLSSLEILGIKASPFLIFSFILLISILLGCVFSLIMLRGFYKPLNKLKNGLKNVASGEFVKVEEGKDDDEINQLIRNYNNMIDELKKMENMSNQFTSVISHEFKTPLTAIKGYATMLENLQDCENVEKERAEYLQKIQIAVDRLSNLSTNILNISKIENTRLISKEKFSLDELVRDCVLMLEDKWLKKEINFDINLEECFINSNAELCQSVITNLLTNAIKFVSSSGEIKINLKKVETLNSVILEVEDDGVGIEEKNLANIFNLFYQVDQSHNCEGNGLGLALVKNIVEKLDGWIKVESRFGKGTKFTVSLPI